MNTYVEEITCVVFVVRLGVYCSGFTGFFLVSGVNATHPMRDRPVLPGQCQVACDHFLLNPKVVHRVLGRE